MLAGLFDEDAALAEDGGGGGQGGQGIPRPLPPRNRTKLCGLSNLGATCYMNALLQTLFYTPELRESLLSLSREELGVEGEPGRIRDIPVQLQHLFARMLLANQDTVGVEGLVSSFGWTNNEQMQQHDVQELNRILFDAIESSLVGTSGEQLISQLYHGTSVQQVICGGCHNVSEREEDFLDIPVALTGRGDLESALKEMFCDVEVLEGSNQYRCETCNCLVDAKRAAKLRKLPPVLTFNLLRFLYDFEKGERYKDLSCFKFPRSLIMRPYLETTRPGNSQKEGEGDEEFIYDLFSVVIHSGTTHSGHYVAFIRDIDRLGVWTQPENEPVLLQKTLSSDVLEYNSPLDLLQAIIPQCGGKATINKLCKLLQDQTGVTWNKRFKQQYGPISKFIRQNSDIFSIDSTNTVTLKSDTPLTSTEKDLEEAMQVSSSSKECTPQKSEDNDGEASDKDVTPVKNDVPVSNGFWFEFNDSHVLSVNPSAIDKMFSGRQSAYMLFYRLRSLKRPIEAAGNPVYGVPQWLQDEVATTNAVLEADRQYYEKAVNTVNICIHPSVYYVYVNGALQNIMNDLIHTISFDRRHSVSQLQATIIQEISEFCILPDTMCISVARQLPAGLHVLECISNDDNASLMDVGILNNAHLFVWNGTTVSDDVIPVGKDHEPILLHLNYPADSDGTLTTISNGFSKSTTILQLRQYFVELLNCSSPQDIHLNQVQRSTRSGGATIQTIPVHKDKNTLADLSLSDGDHLTAELKTKKGYKLFAYSVADKQNKMITFLIENRCVDSGVEDYSVYPVEVSKTEQLDQVKRHITSQLQLDNIEGGGCLCIEDDFEGLGPSLIEDQSVSEAGIESGMRVILKPGHAPLTNQIPLKCSVPGGSFQEVIVDRSCTIKEVCSIMVSKVGLEGDEWHLRKCNWAGESAETIDDEAATVNDLKFRSGEYFLIESGRLPPKGFLRLSVYLYTMDKRRTGGDVPLSVEDWFQGPTGSKDEQMEVTEEESPIPLHEQIPSHYFPQVHGQLDFIGNIEINKDCSVKDLKEQIMCLPELSLSDIPSSDFLRLRDLLNKRPGRVFKDKSHSLKRLKLVSGSSICCQVLPEEENLSATSILFNLYMRQLPSKSYSQPIEVVYDAAVSTTPIGLYSHISHILAMPLDRIVLAKHKFESFQWIRIEGHTLSGDDKEKKGKRKARGGGATGVVRASGKGGTHVNIKNAPISLRDGDHIAVKDLQFDPTDEDDFLTPEDKKGKAILAAIQEEKRRRRKAKSEGDILSGDTSSRNKKQRRPEIGIKIHVPDFSASLSEKPS